MKSKFIKTNSLLFILSLIVSFSACKKSNKKDDTYTCSTCSISPIAKAENNSSNKGVYKGIVIGSSGTITLDIANSGTSVSAILIIDGTTVNLISNNVPLSNQDFTASFTGNLNGQTLSITFSVAANGSSPLITFASIPGHLSASFQLFKETSDNLITCYEGTFSGNDSGTPESGNFNMVVSTKTNTWIALVKNKDKSTSDIMTGNVAGNVFTCDCGVNNIVKGTLTGDQINGTYKIDSQGTWTAKRTL